MAKALIGKVISIKSQKTVTVSIERKFRHPFYKKVIIRHKRLKAHNEKTALKEGDMVKIQETRPLSKDKHFEVVKKISS
ncbi:30S ribosomal protein S17 [Candidatus Roizmanbacteria bacterium]|nr:30S ribosomal protein S17 [Candidatus Roizmanbacteria bacterium]